jgi:hypothetical protein
MTDAASQSVGVHKAYRFETSGDPLIEGTVYKVRPRYVIWEAIIDGTAIKARAETRSEAIVAALRQAGVQSIRLPIG